MRMYVLTRCAWAAGLWLAACAAAVGETSTLQFVADRLVLVVREGPGENLPPIGDIATGDAVVVLETNDTGYARVRMNDGTTGWVQTQGLVALPPASRRVDEIEEELAVLRIEKAQLTGLSDALALDKAELAFTLEESRAKGKSVQDRLAAEVEALRAEIERASAATPDLDLGKETHALREQVRLLHMSNRELRDSTTLRWFLAGGGVAVTCLLLGAFAARITTGRRRSW